MTNGAILGLNTLVVGEIGGDGSGTINIDATSQLNLATSLFLRGTGTYTLPIASTPTNSMISFPASLFVAEATNTNVTLNVNSATSAASSSFTGQLNVGTGGGATGEFNVDGVSLSFPFPGSLGTASSAFGTLGLTGGAVLNVGNLIAGASNSTGGGPSVP